MNQDFERHVQDCCVVVTSGESRTGSGFFVAPRTVVTCRHVVRAEPVNVRWNGRLAEACRVDVVGDLDAAILTLAEDLNAPCVRLATDIRVNDDCYSFGFPLESHSNQRPDSTTICVEGTSDERHEIKLAHGNIRPGQSGSPLINLRTGSVAGIVRLTRGESTDLGGRAVCIDAVLAERPELLRENVEYHEQHMRWSDLAQGACGNWGPPRPRHYVARRSLVDAVEVALAVRECVPSEMDSTVGCALFGPSGFGKTTLAGHIYRRYVGPKQWIDLLQPAAPDETAATSLTVIDGIDSAAATARDLPTFLAQHGWIGRLSGRLLLVTSQEAVGRAILARAGASGSFVRVEQGLSNAEVSDFLSASLIPEIRALLSPALEKGLNEAIHGSPFIWQMAADLANLGELPELFTAARDQGPLEQAVLQLWLKHIAKGNPLTAKVARTLSCLTFLGMSAPALAEVLGESADAVQEAITPLLSRGFVTRAAYFDCTLIPHSLLRKACADKHPDSHEVAKYRSYFGRALEDGRLATDFLTLIDAWLTGIRAAFLAAETDTQTEPFFRRYSRAVQELEALAPSGRNFSLHARWLANFFRDVVQKECAIVIPLARVFMNIPPQQAFAEILWHGMHHEDPAARAFCIKAAAVHWSGQGDATGRHGAECLLRYISGRSKVAEESESFPLAAAVCGTAWLGYRGRVSEYFDRLTQRTPLATLAMLIYLVDHAPRADALEFMSRYVQSIPRETDRFIVEAFLLDEGFQLDPSSAIDLAFNPGRYRVLADMAFSPRFAGFVSKLSAKASGLGTVGKGMTLPGNWPESYFRAT